MKTSPCRQSALPSSQTGTLVRRGCGVLLLFLWLVSTGHTQIADEFSDGDFSKNPGWTGDVANFTVNVAGELQLNARGAATSTLSVRGNVHAAAQWELDGPRITGPTTSLKIETMDIFVSWRIWQSMPGYPRENQDRFRVCLSE